MLSIFNLLFFGSFTIKMAIPTVSRASVTSMVRMDTSANRPVVNVRASRTLPETFANGVLMDFMAQNVCHATAMNKDRSTTSAMQSLVNANVYHSLMANIVTNAKTDITLIQIVSVSKVYEFSFLF